MIARAAETVSNLCPTRRFRTERTPPRAKPTLRVQKNKFMSKLPTPSSGTRISPPRCSQIYVKIWAFYAATLGAWLGGELFFVEPSAAVVSSPVQPIFLRCGADKGKLKRTDFTDAKRGLFASGFDLELTIARVDERAGV
jgi:hypothetical protein